MGIQMNAGGRKLLFSAAFFALSFAFLYGETAYVMGQWWKNDPNYSHGFLIPFISAWFLWQKKEDLRRISPEPVNWGAAVTILGLVLFLFGHLSGEFYVQRFSMVIVLAGTILFCFGYKSLKLTAFPLIFLIFMIPLPYLVYNAFAFPLKLLVSKLSVTSLQIMGIPVLREGNIIHLASTKLEVADACSGIRSIISLLAFSAALAVMIFKSHTKRWVLFSMAVPVAVCANAVRVIGTGYLAHYYGARAALGFFHEFAGLVIFAVAIVLQLFVMFLLSRRWKRNGREE